MVERIFRSLIKSELWLNHLPTFLNYYTIINGNNEIDFNTFKNILNNRHYVACFDYLYIEVDFINLIRPYLDSLEVESNTGNVKNFEILDDLKFSLFDTFKLLDIFNNDYIISYYEGIDMKFPVNNNYKHIISCYYDLVNVLNLFFRFRFRDIVSFKFTHSCFISFRNFSTLLDKYNLDKYIKELFRKSIKTKTYVFSNNTEYRQKYPDFHIIDYFKRCGLVVFFITNYNKTYEDFILKYSLKYSNIHDKNYVIACGVFKDINDFYKKIPKYRRK